MKKIINLLLALLIAISCCVCLTACEKPEDEGETDVFKVGLICAKDEDYASDKKIIGNFKTVCENKRVEYVIETNVSESSVSYAVACDLVEEGCDLIIANSIGYEEHIIKAAKENPDVQFCTLAGKKAKYEHVSNYHNAYASVFEGRYLSGYAAGLKLNAMKDKAVDNEFLVGFVGVYTDAENISAYTAWYLGIQAALDESYSVKMQVQFTGFLYNEYADMEAVQTLLDNGCVIVSQFSDSLTVPNICESKGIPFVSFNGPNAEDYPESFIVSSGIDWKLFFEYIIGKAETNSDIITDWIGGFGSNWTDGSVVLGGLGASAVDGTEEALNQVIAELKSGDRKVFDTSTFTVEGLRVADNFQVDINGDNDNDTLAIRTAENGIKYFVESEYRSAPYFAIQIDNIELLNKLYP